MRVAAVLVLISMGAFTAVAFSDGGRGGGMKQFDACITGSRFLVLTRHGRGIVVETIKDRARRDVVGEVTVNRQPAVMLGGAAAEADGYVMSTATPVGRDARTIEECWDRPFPVA